MADDTKKCPSCAEDVKKEAKVCRYCGAEFPKDNAGYCETCQKNIWLTSDNKCPDCGQAPGKTWAADEKQAAQAAAPEAKPKAKRGKAYVVALICICIAVGVLAALFVLYGVNIWSNKNNFRKAFNSSEAHLVKSKQILGLDDGLGLRGEVEVLLFGPKDSLGYGLNAIEELDWQIRMMGSPEVVKAEGDIAIQKWESELSRAEKELTAANEEIKSMRKMNLNSSMLKLVNNEDLIRKNFAAYIVLEREQVEITKKAFAELPAGKEQGDNQAAWLDAKLNEWTTALNQVNAKENDLIAKTNIIIGTQRSLKVAGY